MSEFSRLLSRILFGKKGSEVSDKAPYTPLPPGVVEVPAESLGKIDTPANPFVLTKETKEACLTYGVTEAIQCLCATILREPKRFKILTRSDTLWFGATPFQFWDKQLNRKWKLTYTSGRHHSGPCLDTDEFPLTLEESKYILNQVAHVFKDRARRLHQLQTIRQQRRNWAIRDALHELYCKGEPCVTSCN